VEPGERVGLIKFGSRVDLFVPMNYGVCVAKGDRVKGGLTWMAQPLPDVGITVAKDVTAGRAEQLQRT
jgi:hypothetical protein